MQSELSVGNQARQMKLNAANERLKHRYFAWLRDAKGLGDHSIDQAAKALDRFETYTRRRGFKEFRTEQASGFKRHLATQNGKRTGTRLSKATVGAREKIMTSACGRQESSRVRGSGSEATY